MRIAPALLLTALGGILAAAVTLDVPGIDVNALGAVLFFVGLLWLAVEVGLQLAARRSRRPRRAPPAPVRPEPPRPAAGPPRTAAHLRPRDAAALHQAAGRSRRADQTPLGGRGQRSPHPGGKA